MNNCLAIPLLISILMALLSGAILTPSVEDSAPATHTASTISTVNGTQISVDEFQRRATAEAWLLAYEIHAFTQSQGVDWVFYYYQTDFISLYYDESHTFFFEPKLKEMELQILLENEAQHQDLIIDEQAVDAELQTYFADFLPESSTKTTTIAIENDFYQSMEKYGIPLEAVRQIFYLRALQRPFREKITEQVPTQEIWTNSRHILIKFPIDYYDSFNESICELEENQIYREKAEQVIERLKAGESFEVLAQELSDDVGSAANSGALGWSPSRQYIEPFADVVNVAPIGEVIGLVCSQYGFHIIQVMDRELRDTPADVLEQMRFNAYYYWEENLIANATIQRRDDWEQFVPKIPRYDELTAEVFGFAQ